MQLTQMLHKALRECPERTATVCGERRRSYRQLVERVARVAAGLRQLGVAPGARVGLLGLNSDRYVEQMLGCFWAGVVVNPVNMRWSPAEIIDSLDDCDTQLLMVDDAYLDTACAVREQSRSLATLIHAGEGATPADGIAYEAWLAQAEPIADARAGGADLAAILYTGGTTGRSKGVMLSHDNIVSNVLSVLAASPRQAMPVGLQVAPLFHVGGISFLLQCLMRQATQVLVPAFDPPQLLALIAQERVSEAFMVPTMIARLLDDPAAAAAELSALTTLIYGAAPMAPALLQRAMTRLPQTGFIQAYGQTECSPVATLLLAADHRSGDADRIASAGRPLATVELRIVDAQGDELDRGTVGEICLRGPGVMSAYWNRPEQTAAALRDGWLQTGDAGLIDDDGYLHVVDRLKDMIISGGENVYSTEVENALLLHPSLSQCAVIGLPDATWGERVHAVVVRRLDTAPVSEAELMAHCRRQIAGYKCPRSIEFRDALPLSGAGKLLKFALRPAKH